MFSESLYNFNFLNYSPSKYSEFEKTYTFKKEIYENPLSPSKIHLAINKNGEKFAIKEIKKDKLYEPFQVQFARNEISIHHSHSKKSKFIASVYEYYENDSSFFMVMEYCSNSNYFQHRLENVFSPFKNRN